MGRWTVAEWLDQLQEHSSFPAGKESLGCGPGVYPHPIDTLLEEDNEFEDEEDGFGKPLPPSPGSGPPTPPPKICNKRRSRGKRGKTDPMHNGSINPERSPKPDSDYIFSRQPDMLVETSVALMPRSPSARRPREFLAGSSVKRTPSKSKSKSKWKMTTGRDGYTYDGPLQILVSTQVTAAQSAHDAARPRVFYPRSSSLPTARPSASDNVPPAIPDKTPTPNPSRTRTARALPPVPVVSAINAPTNNKHRQASTDSGVASSGPRRIRPLPVPRPPS
ncbi:hypothetical protein MSAN_01159700 [Mycena sanguinolenta]|uniref:Uncharacterized protein n=1 Tax=Mycena sanguinolenta TaxID=230812 RepID=A0A8H7D739_9AGAR|nr:hypothetical protein MSAN_01159700 [Mycena sanguinolenta]